MMTLSMKKRSISSLLILSIVCSFFILPTIPAKAGITSSILCSLRPFLKIGGRVAGAIAGASLCGAFFPPLGMIAGGIAGWVVGGIITDYATSSLGNLVTLAGCAAGALALGSFGPIGWIGGALLGGFVGKMLYNVVKGADNWATGGLLFWKKGSSVANSTSTSGNALSVSSTPSTSATGGSIGVSCNQTEIQSAETKYRAAYQNYISATQTGKDVKAAKDAYQAAYENYKSLAGQNAK